MMKTQPISALKRNPSQKIERRADFTNRKLYVGIDVHQMHWQVAVYYEGVILSNTSIEGSSEALVTYLRKHYAGAGFSCVYESDPFAFSLCRSLCAAGIDSRVVNPADIPGTDK